MTKYAPHLLAKFAVIRRSLLHGLSQYQELGDAANIARTQASLDRPPFNLPEVIEQCDKLTEHAQGRPSEPTVLDKVRGLA